MLLNEVNIIGISGKDGVGKDTVARMIQKLTSELREEPFSFVKHVDFSKLSEWKIKHFGTKVKLCAADLLGIDKKYVFTREFKDKIIINNLTGRDILIKLAHDFAREQISQDIWIKSLFRDIDLFDKIIIPDVRYDNEVEYIRSKGGIVIKVINKNVKGNKSAFTDLYDEKLDNSFSYDNTEKRLKQILIKHKILK